jgi:hypothetical protein
MQTGFRQPLKDAGRVTQLIKNIRIRTDHGPAASNGPKGVRVIFEPSRPQEWNRSANRMGNLR